MTNLEPTSGNPKKPSAPSRRPRRNWTRFACGGLLGLGLLVSSPWIYRYCFGPNVDPTLTGAIVIGDGKSTIDSGDPATLPGILAPITEEAIRNAAHPLDPFLDLAERAREKINNEIVDYSAVMMNEIRTPQGKLREPQYLLIKVRHAQSPTEGSPVPFSIYTYFLKPKSLLGQEAIWVDGKNDGCLIAHPAVFNVKRFALDPLGSLAMGDNRYPIYEIGFERLLKQVLEKGRRDREHGTCEVEIKHDVLVNERNCLRITICHPEKKEPFDFHKAIIYVDLELQLPIGYEGFDWPAPGNTDPQLIERYFYSEIKLNVALTDRDFDPDNPDYHYPKY